MQKLFSDCLSFLGPIKTESSGENEDRWKSITDLKREKKI